MYLRNCHIENFGKLHDFTLDFTENPTVIDRENEWGKSTLAAFIRVMFYGFAGENKRGDALERERVYYKPWQGGVYGGELTFETGGKRYRMNRTFGTKEAEDTFALYDGITGVESSDYTEKVGEELFRINSESFRRTVFIAQNDCVTATTDSINAKLGNLAETMDDLGRYEVAQAKIKDEMNSMSPTRKTGSIRKQKEEIAGIRSELRKREAAEKAAADLNQKLAAVQQERENLLRRKTALQEEEALANAYQATAAKKAYYESLLRQRDDRKAAADEALCAMGGHAPENSRLNEAERAAKAMVQLRAEIRANLLNDDEQGQLKAARCASQCNEGTIDRYLEQWKRYERQEADLNAKQAALDDKIIAQTEAMSSGQKGSLLLLLPTVALIAGIVLYLLGYHPLGVGVVTAGIVWLVVLLIRRAADRNELRASYASLADEIAALQQEINEDEDRLNRDEGEILDFLEQCGNPTVRKDQVPALLYELKGKRQQFLALDARQQRCERAKQDYREHEEVIRGFFAEQGIALEWGTDMADTEMIDAELTKLRRALARFASETAQLRSCEQAVEQFERETDMAQLRTQEPETMRLPGEIREELRLCEKTLEQNHRTEHAYLNQLDGVQAELEQLEEQAEILETLDAACKEAQQRYDDLKLTGEYLTRAKELFIAQYTEPITRAYRRYYELLTGDAGEAFRTDANIRVTRREAGEQRDLRTLSTGSRDLTGICLRMARIDAMYPEEKPFVILDDSFVNLDDERLACAKRFLREISKKYQIIYFTCQKSRELA